MFLRLPPTNRLSTRASVLVGVSFRIAAFPPKLSHPDKGCTTDGVAGYHYKLPRRSIFTCTASLLAFDLQMWTAWMSRASIRDDRKMRRDFKGKRVLLTGASSGIGWYVADSLVRAGAYVIVTGRRKERLDQLRLSFGNPQKRLISVPGDVADHDHRLTLVATAAEQLGGVDILINNAGIGAVGHFEEASSERLRRVFEVDFFAATELTRLALPYLRRGNEPAICLVNSVLGHRGVPNKSEYCAAKFALRGWSESLRLELKPAGIDVVAVSPSTTQSEFFDSLVDTNSSIARSPFGAQSSAKVADSVLRALRKRKRDMILSPGGKMFVWLSRFAPKFTDRLLLEYGAT